MVNISPVDVQKLLRCDTEHQCKYRCTQRKLISAVASTQSDHWKKAEVLRHRKRAQREDSDPTVRTYRKVEVFDGPSCDLIVFVMQRL